MISLRLQGKPFNIMVIPMVFLVCPNQECWRSWIWTVLWRPTRPFKTNTCQKCPFIYRGLECKSGKSRNTWSNRQIWPWSTKQSRSRLTEFCQENALVIANTIFQQHNRRLYTWTSPTVNAEIRLIIFFAAKGGEALYSQQKQDRERTVAQIMNSLLPNSDLDWRK